MAKWEELEERFLSENLFEDVVEVHNRFTEKFGLTRSRDSIRRKLQRLREKLTLDSNKNNTSEDTSLTPLSLLDPTIVKQQIDVWLRMLASQCTGLDYEIKPALRSSNKSLVILLSDIHWGKQTKSFNMATASDRIFSIPYYLKQQELPEFDEIVLVLLGDLVEGEGIFEHQYSILEAPVITAHKEGTEVLWQTALALRDTFGVPVRIETGYGNHGRMSKAAHPKSNWDNAIYQSLYMISEFSEESDVVVNLNLEEFQVIEVKGARILLTHEGTKHLSTPATVAKFAGWIISKDIDLMLQGHWHNHSIDTFLGRTRICNGSVSGPDDLSEKMGKDDPARQVYFIIDPNKAGFTSCLDYIQWS